eukprot:10065918-Alexandrium_andersonii.AAC.1
MLCLMLALAAGVLLTARSSLRPPVLLQHGPWTAHISISCGPLSACAALASCAVAETVAILALLHGAAAWS